MNTALEKHNRSFQPRFKKRVHADEFLTSYADDNLLVTGGQEEMRLNLLIERLSQRDGTTVIFTSSETAEQALISASADGKLNRKLIISSPVYPTYDPLYGISKADMAAFLANIGEILGYKDRGVITGYFTPLAKLYNAPLSLRGITNFITQFSAAEILQMAAENDIGFEALQEAAAGAKPFRDILSLLDGEFERFTAESKLSIGTAVGEPVILCIRPTGNPKLAASLFAAELRSVLHKSFELILFGTPLLHDEGFLETVLETRQQNTVSVFTRNLMTYKNHEAIQSDMGAQIILLDGRVNDADLQSTLDAFGSYTHFVETIGSSTPMQILPLSLKSCKSTGVTSYSRPKVLLQEIIGNQAVLFGHADEITVAALIV